MLTLKKWEPVTYQGDGFAVGMEVKRLGFLEGKAFQVQYSRVHREGVVRHMLLAQADEIARKRKVLARTNDILAAAGLEPVAIGEDLDAAHATARQRMEAAGIEEPPLTAEELEALLGPVDEARAKARQEAMEAYFASLDETWLAGVYEHFVRNVSGLVVDDAPIETGAQLGDVADQALTMFVLEAISGFSSLSSAEKKVSSSPPISGPVAGPGDSPATSAAPANGTDPATAPEPPADGSSSA